LHGIPSCPALPFAHACCALLHRSVPLTGMQSTPPCTFLASCRSILRRLHCVAVPLVPKVQTPIQLLQGPSCTVWLVAGLVACCRITLGRVALLSLQGFLLPTAGSFRLELVPWALLVCAVHALVLSAVQPLQDLSSQQQLGFFWAFQQSPFSLLHGGHTQTYAMPCLGLPVAWETRVCQSAEAVTVHRAGCLCAALVGVCLVAWGSSGHTRHAVHPFAGAHAWLSPDVSPVTVLATVVIVVVVV
jgi:hypothetical protein